MFAPSGEPGDGPDVASWLTSCRSVLDRYFTLEDPRLLEPAERELYVETLLDSRLLLRGFVDRVDVAPDGAIRVVDYKTGRSPGEMFEAKALFQMKFYALVIWRTRGVVPAMLQLVYLGNGEILRYVPDERDLLATERKVEAIWHAIRRRARSPATGGRNPSRLCDWCAHQAICPAFGGTPPPLPERGLPTPGPGSRRRARLSVAQVEHAGHVDAAGAAQRRVVGRLEVHPTPSPSSSMSSTPVHSGSSGSSWRIRSSSARTSCDPPLPTVRAPTARRARRGRRPGPARARRSRGRGGSSAPRSGPAGRATPSRTRGGLGAAGVERAAQRRARGVGDLARAAGRAGPSARGPARGSPPAAPSCTGAAGWRRSPRSARPRPPGRGT